MSERIIQEAKQALDEGFEGILGLRQRWGQVGPYLFRREQELEELVTEPKYTLVKVLRQMLQKNPDRPLAAVLRGCDVRALRELEKSGQLKTDRLRTLGIICSEEQAAICNCTKPTYDTLKCVGCWECLEACPEGAIQRINVCPVLAPSEYDVGLNQRKAIYIPYAQAVPLKATRDRERCLKIRDLMDCKGCEYVCQAEAITHEDRERSQEVPVGSVILSPGFTPFDPSQLDIFGGKQMPNVLTSMEFERVLSASGPTGGHLVRLSDHKEPKKIAWLQCVGSRDINRCDNFYCSSVCCMYAIKEAVIAKEHADYDLDCALFYMDIRTHGKDFERYYNRAQEQGVRFVRSRIHSVTKAPDKDELELRYMTDEGKLESERFDLLVLSIGLEISPASVELAEKLGIELTAGKFASTGSFHPVASSRKGIYVAGAFQGPKDIPQSVVDSSAAASSAEELLSVSRHTQTKSQEKAPEVNVVGERPRIGVFVCNCGSNIGGIVNVPEVRDYAAQLPFVEYVTDNLYTCSQDSQDIMTQTIRDKGLNRVVVAACTPKTHEPLFQETLMNAGLNKYLFEMVNIRNQDSWVHRFQPERATQKAKDLVRVGVSKAAFKEPLQESELNINHRALVIGGGLSGLASAASLAKQGFETHIVERQSELGGQARRLYKTWKGESVQEGMQALIEEVQGLDNLQVHLGTEITNVDGFVGNFATTLTSSGREETIEHGVAIVATGGSELKPSEYLYGEDPRVKTAQELDGLFIKDDPSLKEINTAVFIQCVGSREPERPYCSRVCCTHSMESALEIKRRNPQANVFILYRDLRTYGEREELYIKAREAGVIFIRFDLDSKPQLVRDGDALRVRVADHITGYPLEIETDIIQLASAILPTQDEKLAQFFKLPLNDDGFFVERHAKLGPSEFAMDGVYLCGLAHYPKPIDEAVAQGQAAAARAVSVLSQDKLYASGEIAQINPLYCVGCAVCTIVCPYGAPSLQEEGRNAGKAEINPALCKGCGLCMASCRSGAISLKGSDERQVYQMIEAL